MLTIAVVGAGTAGAAAATLLARAGHAVTVFERVADPKPIGAGITIQPTGQVVLARLGILGDFVEQAAHIERLCAVRPNGKVLVDLPYADIDARMIGLGTHRGLLFATLLGALRSTTATVRLGIHIASTDVDPHGRYLIDEAGERHGPFDLVIAADGSVSELHHAHPNVKSTPYPWGALWFVTEDPGFAADRKIHQIVDGCHTLLGFLPTGRAPGHPAPLVSLFWSMRADRVEAWRATGFAGWKDRIRSLEPRGAPILDAIGDHAQVLFTRYRDVAMWPWHCERLVFLGDAAHATSPQLGQGANLALIDAAALADAIEDQCAPARGAPEPGARGHTPTMLVARALEAYSNGRRRHLAFYQFMTRMLTPLFQSDSRMLGFFRDRIFPINRWFRYLRRRMVRTMVGIDRGLLRAPFPILDAMRQLPAGSDRVKGGRSAHLG